jgi:hypothetical protein
MPPKIQMKIEEKNVCKFRSTCILNTFSIDESLKKINIHITIHGNYNLPFLRISQITVNQ